MGSAFVPRFAVQYFVSFLVLQSSRWGRESRLLITLSSWCHVTVFVLCAVGWFAVRDCGIS